MERDQCIMVHGFAEHWPSAVFWSDRYKTDLAEKWSIIQDILFSKYFLCFGCWVDKNAGCEFTCLMALSNRSSFVSRLMQWHSLLSYVTVNWPKSRGFYQAFLLRRALIPLCVDLHFLSWWVLHPHSYHLHIFIDAISPSSVRCVLHALSNHLLFRLPLFIIPIFNISTLFPILLLSPTKWRHRLSLNFPPSSLTSNFSRTTSFWLCPNASTLVWIVTI